MSVGTVASPASGSSPPKGGRRWWRITWRVLVGLVALLVVLALFVSLALVWAVRRPMPVTNGTLRVPGLDSTVTVQRDGWGIPDVYASTSHDLFFAQGYVHAQDRFWEMDFRRHVTAGRLSEMFGDTTLETDEFVRTMGWRRVAEQEVGLLSPEAKALMQAYADGVNAYLADKAPAQLSLEYSILALTNRGYHVEPWSIADSLAWLKAMSYDLAGNATSETERVLTTAAVGPARSAQLFPAYPYDRHRPILDQGAWSGSGSQAVFDQDLPAPGQSTKTTAASLDATRAALGSFQAQYATVGRLLGLTGQHAGAGSNNWVVAGKYTVSGKPLLANDPHLLPGMPSIWVQMGLHCTQLSAACPYDVSGYTFSGFPGVIIGHNGQIAWGFTNLGPDTQDLFLEKVEGDATVVDGSPVPMQTRTEVVKVAGGSDVNLTVRTTTHGPLMSDVSDDYADVGKDAAVPTGSPDRGDGYGVSIEWTALTPGRTAEAVFGINRATDWSSFTDSVRLFETPSQNIVYANVNGDIGYATGGTFPVRKGFDGLTPAPGWDSRVGWDGYVPAAAVPNVLNPKDGFIVTANNQLTYPGLGYEFVVDNTFGTRSQRITDRLTSVIHAGTKLSAAEMTSIQNDAYNEPAAWAVPLAQQVSLDGTATTARGLWDGWDYSMTADSAPAAYFAAFYRALLKGVFYDELSSDVVTVDSTDRWYEVLRDLPPDDPWWDDTTTPEVEDRSAMMARALQLADQELRSSQGDDPAKWRWGTMHTLLIQNPTFGDSGIAPIEWLFNRGPVETGGTGAAPDATDWNVMDGYGITWIPSMRMVVDLSDLDASTWINLTGASGHAFNRHYADQAPLWATGRTTPFAFSRTAVEAAVEDTLTLQP